MFKQNTFSENNLYRGSLPFFLAEEKKGVIFLASSNKNIEDYYYTLKDFYNGEIIKIDDFEDENSLGSVFKNFLIYIFFFLIKLI